MADNMGEHLLNRIHFPADLHQLSEEQLPEVCAELRQYIIDVLSENPGHLGASLGTVELTVALHYVFNAPYDRIVWDVGHQAYGHKILTGRREAFHTLRKFGGISGFPNPAESEYDAFIAGHASNSISAAMGMAVASALKHEDRHVIAVIGDGAMTGGLAFEGLNNASVNPNNLLIILNDNNMAIDHSVGGLSQYLVDITTSQAYNKMRYDVYRGLKKINLIDDSRRDNILRFNNSLKALLTQQHNLFEGFSIRYFGPVDGHDVGYLVKLLNDIKDMQGPKLLHIKTKKGKGFKPAEESATEWHAPGRFNKETGERIIVHKLNEPQLYQDVFGHTLVELAEKDERIVGITPAMPTGCSMTYLMKEFPDRAFDVGIAEGHAVTFSAGLAKEGMIPFCNVYSSFMQRAYDNVIHDVAIQDLPVVMCLDRGGIVGEDGVTHHGVFDMAAFGAVPGLTIAAPMDELELRNMMYTGLQYGHPFMIRYPRGNGAGRLWRGVPFEALPVGRGRRLREGTDVALVTVGTVGNAAARAAERAAAKGVSVAHYDLRFAKPLDEALLAGVGAEFRHVVTVEDGSLRGGVGEAVTAFFNARGCEVAVHSLGIGDEWVEHGTPAQLYALCGYDEEGILRALLAAGK